MHERAAYARRRLNSAKASRGARVVAFGLDIGLAIAVAILAANFDVPPRYAAVVGVGGAAVVGTPVVIGGYWLWAFLVAPGRLRDELLAALSSEVSELKKTSGSSTRRLPKAEVSYLGVWWRFVPTWGRVEPFCREHGQTFLFKRNRTGAVDDLRDFHVITAEMGYYETSDSTGQLFCGFEGGHRVLFDTATSYGQASKVADKMVRAELVRLRSEVANSEAGLAG